MSSIAPISAPPAGAMPASTPAAEALSRPAVATKPAAATQQAAKAQQQASEKKSASELQKQIEQALSEAHVQTNLRFRVDEEANRVVVTVVDADTGETIAQIPDEAALSVARRLAATGRGLLDQQA